MLGPGVGVRGVKTYFHTHTHACNAGLSGMGFSEGGQRLRVAVSVRWDFPLADTGVLVTSLSVCVCMAS